MTRLVSSLAFVILAPVSAQLFAQDFTPPDQQAQLQQQQPQQQFFAPEQLDSMVAPIALYPDALLSQVLVASTYPLEIVEANQWLLQNGNLQGASLVQAAQQQNWDPSIQALVPFQDVIKRLASDVRWTTDLGNAFLGQQADVMNAVQRMRQRARENGRLTDTPQQRIIEDNQDGQSAIEIQPADPEVVYVPTYNPSYFWGQPDYYPWPDLYYPVGGYGWGWGSGIHVGFFFGGFGGWRNWGWCPRWYNHSVILNSGFFNRYNYRGYGGGHGFRGTTVWAHNPDHRLSVPYANRGVAQRFAGGNSYQPRNDMRGRQQGVAPNGQRFNDGAQRFNGGNAYQPRNEMRSPQQSMTPNQYRGQTYGGGQNYNGAGAQRFSGGNAYQPRNEMRSPQQSVTPNQYRGQTYGGGQNYNGAGAQRFSGGNSYQPRNEMRAPQQSAAPRNYAPPSQGRSFAPRSAPSAPSVQRGGGGGAGGGGGGGGHVSSGGGGHHR